MEVTDVLIVGGGPAGLSSAIACLQRGLGVIVADARQPLIDKACGEGIMPQSITAAAKLGLEISPGDGQSFRGIQFNSGEQRVAADFSEAEGIGIRRTALHELLVHHTQKMGAKFLWGNSVGEIGGVSIAVGGRSIRSRWIIGADGAHSQVRRKLQIQTTRCSTRFSYRCHFRRAPWSRYVEIYWRAGLQFYITPIGKEEICVVLMTRNPHIKISDALPLFSILQQKLMGAEASSAERGAAVGTLRLRSVFRENAVLVGDASGTIDPISGEGLGLAFRQASALAEGLIQNDLRFYAQAHAQISRRPQLLSDLMLIMDRSAHLQRLVIKAFDSKPGLFAEFLEMHSGSLKAVRLPRTTASLAWQMIRGISSAGKAA